MDIRASGTVTRESIKKIIGIIMFGRFNPINQLIIASVLILISLCIMLFIGVIFGFNRNIVYFFILIALCILLQLYTHFIAPKINIKRNGKLLGMVSNYSFRETEFDVESSSAVSCSKATVQYSVIKRVYETDRWIFLLLVNKTFFCIDKPTETDMALVEHLKRVAPKYTVITY